MNIKTERAYSVRISDHPCLYYIGDTILSVLNFSTGLNRLAPVRPCGFMKKSEDWICDRFYQKNGVTEVPPLSENIRYTESNVILRNWLRSIPKGTGQRFAHDTGTLVKQTPFFPEFVQNLCR